MQQQLSNYKQFDWRGFSSQKIAQGSWKSIPIAITKHRGMLALNGQEDGPMSFFLKGPVVENSPMDCLGGDHWHEWLVAYTVLRL